MKRWTVRPLSIATWQLDHTRYSHGLGNQFSSTTVMLRRVEMAGCAHYMACCAKLYENKTLYGPLFAEAFTEIVLICDILKKNTNYRGTYHSKQSRALSQKSKAKILSKNKKECYNYLKNLQTIQNNFQKLFKNPLKIP